MLVKFFKLVKIHRRVVLLVESAYKSRLRYLRCENSRLLFYATYEIIRWRLSFTIVFFASTCFIERGFALTPREGRIPRSHYAMIFHLIKKQLFDALFSLIHINNNNVIIHLNYQKMLINNVRICIYYFFISPKNKYNKRLPKSQS